MKARYGGVIYFEKSNYIICSKISSSLLYASKEGSYISADEKNTIKIYDGTFLYS